MEYRVEELATAAGVRVDTVRFYQGRGLIPHPRRVGRVAIYDDGHLCRLREIRSLLDQGFSLAQIGRLGTAVPAPEGEGGAQERELLEALVAESVGPRTLSRAEFEAEAGIAEPLLGAVLRSGLIEPVRVDGEPRFTASDVALAKAGLALLAAGLPADELLSIARTHVRNIQELADGGIDLFDDHIRKSVPGGRDDGAIAEAFRHLLPQVTRLVALHFQRTLVNRAIERLRRTGDGEALERALAASEAGHLEVEWR